MRFIIAVTGASGSLYGLRLIRQLAARGHELDVVISEPGCLTLAQETGIKLNAHRWTAKDLVPNFPANITPHSPKEIGATIASGSVRHDGMVVIPCSMGTLGRIAQGMSGDLIARAADVTLKERRKLILVTREMPLSLIHLRNMTVATEAGALICPASPHFYNRPDSIEDVVDTVVERVVDQLGVEQAAHRWKGEPK